MEEVLGRIGMTIVAAILLWWQTRPRKPKSVYAHFNRALCWGLYFPLIIVLVLINVLDLIRFFLPQIDLPPFIVISSILLGVIGWVVYALYWSHPYSRKRTGVVAVDAAVERYKKPVERIRGMVEGGWCPDLVLGEKVYKLLTYKRGYNDYDILVLDLNGQVVRDYETAKQVVRLWRLACEESDVYHMNVRMYRYQKLHQGLIVQLPRQFLNRAEELIGYGANEQERKDIETLLEFMQAARESARALLNFLENEAAVHERYGRLPVAERICWEDLEALERLWQIRLRKDDELRAFASEARRAVKRLREKASMPKRLAYVVRTAEILLEELKLELPVQAYSGFSEEEAARWRSRLGWVDIVDGWVREGYTGKALEEKKRAYLAEQERLEKERVREERRRRREERKRQREMRAQGKRE